MIYKIDEHIPSFPADQCFVADNATVIGRVTMGKACSIWFGAVLRADDDTITIGEGSNVQDCAVLHVDPGYPMSIGNNVTIGHHAMVHGCTIGDGSLIGINAVVLNGAKIGKNCLIGANALVTENMEVPDGAMVLGSPAKVKKILSPEQQAGIGVSAEHYQQKIPRYNQRLEKV